jgi:hypothetical protein
VHGDVTNKAHCDEIVERAVREFGKLDAMPLSPSVMIAALPMRRPAPR